MRHNFSSDKLLYQNNNIDNILVQTSNICPNHNKEYNFYCKTCSMDICLFCNKNHINHELISYQIIYPKKDEIKLLFETIKNYNDDYNKLLTEILSWRKEIDKIIYFYHEQLKNNKKLNDNINFIYNCNYYKMNYNLILKFRQIYSNIIIPQKRQNNNQILNYMSKGYDFQDICINENKMGLFDYNNYSKMKICLNKIENNKKNFYFLNNSNYIIEILWNTYFEKKKERNKYNNINLYNNKIMYNKNDINSLSDGNLKKIKTFLSNEINNNNNYEFKLKNNIIEKYINLSSNSKNNTSLNSEENIMKYNPIFNSKVGNIFLDQNNSVLKSSKNNDNSMLYKNSISNSPMIKNNLFPFNLNSFEYHSDKKIYYKKRNNSKSNWIKKRSNSYNYSKDNRNLYLSNINIDEKLNENIAIIEKYVPKIKVHNRIYIDKDKQGKTYIHKKFNPKNINQLTKISKSKDKLYSPKINIFSNKKSEENFHNEQYNISNISDDNKLNNTFTQSETFKKKLNLENYDYNITNNLTPMNKNINNKNKKFLFFNHNESNDKNKYTNNSCKLKLLNSKDKYNFKIIKNSFQKKYIVDTNKPLCIGLELSNSNCKIGIINKNEETNDVIIDLFCFKENKYYIPTILSFNEKKEEIKIGYEAYDSLLDNSSKTIFNIMKIFGKNYNDINIKNKLNLYPYNIYSNENMSSRPYIKINFNKKEKTLYFEDLFTIYIKRLFDIFFSEIEIKEHNKNKYKNNILQLILVIGVSDNLNYIQRKIIEKILQTQIFTEYYELSNEIDIKQDNNISIASSKLSTSQSVNSLQSRRKKKLYGGYQIILKDIRIENSSSIASLCLKTYCENIRNILTVNINGDSTNISISSIYDEKSKNKKDINKIYELKIENCIEKGEIDFIDNFIEKKFQNNLNTNMVKEYIKLRKNCNDIIQNININRNNSLIYDENNNNMKKEFIKSLNDIYNEIIFSIKKMLKEGKINENNINDIILIGPISKTNLFIQMIKKLFKYNKDIVNQLSLIEKINNSYENNISNDNDTNKEQILDDFLVACGAAIQSYTLSNINSKILLIDISPNSFGIESLDGLMEFVIEKGTKIPVKNQKFVKIKNNNENYLEINIYEGENKDINKNKNISCVNIDKKNFKNEKICNNYIELLIQFEIDKYFNLRVYVLEPKSLKRRFECLINIDVIRG